MDESNKMAKAMLAQMNAPKTRLSPCKFRFDYPETVYDGFAHDSTWNGFDNVAVTMKTLQQIIAAQDDEETREMFRELTPMDDGLFSLGWGFTTQIVK
jgi:hypothetical protein